MATTVLIILMMILATLGLGYAAYFLIDILFGFEPSIDIPTEARLVSLLFLAAGAIAVLDTVRYRRPKDVLVSTSDSLMKLVRRRPLGERIGRTEPFVPKGPYRYVRNPMYFGVVMLSFGIGIALSSSPLLFWGVALICWFWFLLIPFEEKELGVLFGEGYVEYRKQVPKLFPYGRKFRPIESNR